MSDGGGTPVEPSPQLATTAGGLLKQARLAKGLHIAALATAIKVTPRKLELLESDRFDELPGPTFIRALAQTVCRTLKIDSAPVLALLPQPADEGLARLSLGLNEPFRDKPGRRVPNDLSFLKSPVLLGAVLLAVASMVLYLLPAGWVSEITRTASPPRTGSDPTEPASQPSVTTTTISSSPAPMGSPASEVASAVPVPGAVPSSEPAASVPASADSSPQPSASSVTGATPAGATPSGALLLRSLGQSWVEVVDGRGQPLLSRLLQAGETVGLDGTPPLRVRIGNAAAMQVSFRGKPVELSPSRDNVAKLELR